MILSISDAKGFFIFIKLLDCKLELFFLLLLLKDPED